MELKIVRQIKSKVSTIGTLYIDGIKECNTLEDIDRKLTSTDSITSINANKTYSKTAIPTGRYEVIIDMSARFKKLMPHILNVPGFEGIRIHSGNTDADTEGCILLGTADHNTKDFIGNSRDAFNKFYPKLEEALKKDNVFINII